MPRPPILPVSFYSRGTLDVARDLIGKLLVHRTPAGIAAGLIVETEAYIGEEDPACHAAKGRTPRNAPLYGPPGLAYVYLSYGVHPLVNAVTERDGFPAAVLIRALEPVDGLPLMRRRRRRSPWRKGKPEVADHALCRGPGNLSVALGISLAENLAPLGGPALTIEDHGRDAGPVGWTSRIGISAGQDKLWRCAVIGHRAVSARPAR
ncbi:MAG: DNA-3-methyladenine glycosylase [Vicinamibacterales bacterium]|nr:DNA-3-methyladenine glycosylase [Vicinamibacterales bacterium]